MNPETVITLNVNATAVFIGILSVAGLLIAAVWKAKMEIGEALDKSLRPTVETMDKIKGNVKVVSDFLMSSGGFDHTKLQAYSPLRVTPIGEQYLSEVGFVQVFAEHLNDFYECIDHDHPSGDYDIQNAAIRSVVLLFSRPYFSTIKEHFYNHPDDDKKSFFQVAGIYVRDKYMAREKPTTTA